MSDYPKFKFDKKGYPYWPLGLTKEFEEYAKRQMHYLQELDTLNTSMSLDESMEYILGRSKGMMPYKPMKVRPHAVFASNHLRTHWLFGFYEQLNNDDNDDR